MRIAIMSACSAKKSLPAQVSIADMPKGVRPQEWLAALEGKPICEAWGLYTGASVKLFHKAMVQHPSLHIEMLVASAGLGIVHERDTIPSYEATFAAAGARVKDRFNGTNKQWMTELTALRKRPLPEYDLIIAALPQKYREAIPDSLRNVLYLTLNEPGDNAVSYDWRLYNASSPYRAGKVHLYGQMIRHYLDKVYPKAPNKVDLSEYER